MEENLNSADVLEAVANNRGCRKKGDELDYEKAAFLLLDDFRNGRLGRITIECPEEFHGE